MATPKEQLCKKLDDMITDEAAAYVEYLGLYNLLATVGHPYTTAAEFKESFLAATQKDENKHRELLLKFKEMYCET